ncbi:MAG: YceI family protein [Gemmatimonadota bacterium]|nr:YceI family protein [Gemmatimonadota bacterium]
MLLSVAAVSLFASTLGLGAPASDTTIGRRSVEPVVYKIDATHSSVEFVIRHFMSRVRGQFKDWSGTIAADPADWSTGSVEVTIQTASITTNSDRRDNDLRSPNFFEVDKNPTITFKSTKVERTGDNLKISGDLTMKGTTKPVVLEGKFLGAQKLANGKSRVGFEASVTLNRLDYGVKWNRVVEGGGMMLGDDVKIEITVEAIQQ